MAADEIDIPFIKKDFEICEDFFSKILAKDKNPDYLKSLIGISRKTNHVLRRCIRDYQKEHDQYNAGYIESRLIRRFLKPSSFLNEKIQEVEGPVSIYQMSHPEYPQIFYLFGDIHVEYSRCSDTYNIIQWIGDTIRNSPMFIDVYVESSYVYKNYPRITSKETPNKNYLSRIYHAFRDCFKKYEKEGTFHICHTSRFHYTDMRSIFETEQQKEGYIIIMLNELVTLENVDFLNAFINLLLNTNSIIHQRIQKQFNNITDSKIREKLEGYLKKCQELYQCKIKPINIDLIKWPINPDDHITARDVVNRPAIGKYEICLMDCYLMGRCFRSYTNGSKYHRPSYNNIVYAGAGHIRNYISILKKLGFEIGFKDVNFLPGKEHNDKMKQVGNEKYYSSIPNFQCINVSEMEQPMFHQRYRQDG